jgi:ferritin-like metal-binding protein YciE
MKLLLIIYYNTQQQMSLEPDDNNSSDSSANAIAIVGLNLALSYENSAVDRLEKRVAESIIPEVKEKIKRHLEHTKQQQERLKERIKASGRGMMEPISEKGRLPIPEPPQKLKIMIESNSSDKEREVWESLNDLIIERAEAIMYKGGIQALELLKTDKKTIKALEKNLEEEEAFGDWLEKNNPKIAKRLMTKQTQENKQGKKKRKRKTMQEESAEEEAVSATAAS